MAKTKCTPLKDTVKNRYKCPLKLWNKMDYVQRSEYNIFMGAHKGKHDLYLPTKLVGVCSKQSFNILKHNLIISYLLINND